MPASEQNPTGPPRLAAIAFGVLVAATVGALFLVDALKVTSAIVYHEPIPVPAAFNPISGRNCISHGKTLNYRRSSITFSVSHSDDVGVYVVPEKNPAGSVVATVSSGTEMVQGYANTKEFFWDGHLDNGRVAKQGAYYFRIALPSEDRTVNLDSYPVEVIRSFPHPQILSVTAPREGRGDVAIRYSAGTRSGTGLPRRVVVVIYRMQARAKLVRVQQFATSRTGKTATWNEKNHGKPVRPGTYLIGITAQDAACDQATWPGTEPSRIAQALKVSSVPVP